ncbi:MAG: HIT family protein [Parachlamydiaceae bacterium]|nr:HIT family protein [Parachlamydiaceae bacterium]
MNFELHPNLSKKEFIIDLPLCRVLLENEFNYPWILLVPRRSNVSRIMDLDQFDQLQLLKELDLTQKILWDFFHLTQLNVAAIGNKTPQLHIHIIGRRADDPAWPHTVWDHPEKRPYTPQEKEVMIQRLKSAF